MTAEELVLPMHIVAAVAAYAVPGLTTAATVALAGRTVRALHLAGYAITDTGGRSAEELRDLRDDMRADGGDSATTADVIEGAAVVEAMAMGVLLGQVAMVTLEDPGGNQ